MHRIRPTTQNCVYNGNLTTMILILTTVISFSVSAHFLQIAGFNRDPVPTLYHCDDVVSIAVVISKSCPRCSCLCQALLLSHCRPDTA